MNTEIKYSKSEQKFILHKRYNVFFTLPVKFINNKKINALYKKYPSVQFLIVFCKKAKKNTFYHTFFESGDIHENFTYFQSLHGETVVDIMSDINRITGLYPQ